MIQGGILLDKEMNNWFYFVGDVRIPDDMTVNEFIKHLGKQGILLRGEFDSSKFTDSLYDRYTYEID
jgi:hypothetical protein